jgi:DNA adenine methylase
MARLIPLFPPHQLYVSVFGGSGTDILRKPPSRSEVFNDRHGEVTNFFRVLQDRREELLERLRVTPVSRPQFEECLWLLRSGEGDPVLRAWAFVTGANQCRNGMDPLVAWPACWSPSVLRRLLRWTELPERLLEIAARLRAVVIERRDWSDVLRPLGSRGYDSPDTFFFLDPPYLPTSRDTGSRRVYSLEMSEADHERLLSRLVCIQGKAMLCGYDSALYRRYLGRWRREQFEVNCWASGGPEKPKRVEVVWMNY